MPKNKYSYRRSRDWSKVERVLMRGGWPFVILDNTHSVPRVMLAVATDGMGPTHPAAEAFAKHITEKLNDNDNTGATEVPE